eukprot:548607-Hanusia_phi.AAC.1
MINSLLADHRMIISDRTRSQRASESLSGSELERSDEAQSTPATVAGHRRTGISTASARARWADCP